MASSPTLTAGALFLLLAAIFSTAAHGRESHFFSKVTANTNPTPTTTTTTVSVSPDSKSTVNTNNLDPNVVNNGQPSFVQETKNSDYGIYDNQTPKETTSFDQTATNTKLTSTPTNNFRPYNQQTNSDETFRSENANNNNNNEKYYNNDQYYGERRYNGDNNNEMFADEEQEKLGETNLKQQDNKKSVTSFGWDFGNSGYEYFP